MILRTLCVFVLVKQELTHLTKYFHKIGGNASIFCLQILKPNRNKNGYNELERMMHMLNREKVLQDAKSEDRLLCKVAIINYDPNLETLKKLYPLLSEEDIMSLQRQVLHEKNRNDEKPSLA